MIGIPYASAEVSAEGVTRTCPECGERCTDPHSFFTAEGETSRPDAYSRHFAEKHDSTTRRDAS